MSKKKTIPELQAKIAANEQRLAQLQHKQQQLTNRISYCEKGERRKRAYAAAKLHLDRPSPTP